MVPIDSEGNRPKLMEKGQSSSMVSVRLLFTVLLFRVHRMTESLLKFFLGFTQVVEQAPYVGVVIALKVCGELFRATRDSHEVIDQRLSRMCVIAHCWSSVGD